MSLILFSGFKKLLSNTSLAIFPKARLEEAKTVKGVPLRILSNLEAITPVFNIVHFIIVDNLCDF